MSTGVPVDLESGQCSDTSVEGVKDRGLIRAMMGTGGRDEHRQHCLRESGDRKTERAELEDIQDHSKRGRGSCLNRGRPTRRKAAGHGELRSGAKIRKTLEALGC